jgi:Sulfotransferase family
MPLPNFMVIGAAKAGTSSVCEYLDQHPDVYMCPGKEPNFFVAEDVPEIPFRGPRDHEVLTAQNGWVWNLQRYRDLFAGVSTEHAVGEGSTWYLYDELAPLRIRRRVPAARLIAILRNPVDRAYSAFTMLQMDGRETTASFEAALAAEDERVCAGWEYIWHYRRMSMYFAQLQRYYGTFVPEQIRVVLYEDLTSSPREIMRDLFQFIGVDDRFEPDMSERSNPSYVPRHPEYQRMIVRQSRLKRVAKALLPGELRQRLKEKLVYSTMTRPAPLAPELRQKLAETFRPDVLRLQELLGRDLSPWLA